MNDTNQKPTHVIACADAWLRDAGQPTYSDLLAKLERSMTATHTQPAGCDLDSLEGAELLYTSRGFALLNFKDHYGVECSIQKSSLATEDAIWFGPSDAEPKIMAVEAAAHGIDPGDGTGWVPFPIPCGVSLTTRAHLTRDQVAALLPVFQHFADTGDVAAARAAQAPQGDTRQGAPVYLAAELEGAEPVVKVSDLATPAAHTCTPADERARREQENSEFTEWWNSKQACPEHSITTENAAHAAWQERGRRAAQGAGTAPVQVQTDAWGVEYLPGTKWVQDHDGRVELMSRQNAENICINKNYRAVPLRVEIYRAATHPAPVSTAAATTVSASGGDTSRNLAQRFRAIAEDWSSFTFSPVSKEELLAAADAMDATTSRAADGQQGASRAALDEPMLRDIVTKAREFYLGYLSRHIPADDIDAVRAKVTTDTACRAIAFDLRAAQSRAQSDTTGESQ